MDTAGGTDDNMGATALELLNIILNDGTTNAGLNLDVLVLTDGVNDVSNLHRKLTGGCDNKGLTVVGSSVNRLEDTDSECTSLTSSGLSLSNSVLALNERQDSFHLDRRRVFVTISVNTTKDLFS